MGETDAGAVNWFTVSGDKGIALQKMNDLFRGGGRLYYRERGPQVPCDDLHAEDSGGDGLERLEYYNHRPRARQDSGPDQ